jgi:broad specificity phosphatase PhoE
MTRLLVVRHGRTDWNAQGRVQGGGSLDEVGQQQVDALMERLRHERIDGAYCSPVLRTRQTAYAVLAPHGVTVQESKNLTDLDYGTYSGAHLDEARKAAPSLWEMWDKAPNTVHFPSGEGLADLRRRLGRFLAEVVAKYKEGTVLVATHDSPVRVLSCMAMGLDDSYHHLSPISLASLTILDVGESGVTMVLHNDSTHLSDIHDTETQTAEEQPQKGKS